jgi:hypothetical protein
MGRDTEGPEKSRSSTEMSAAGRVVVFAGCARSIDGDSSPAGLAMKQIPRRVGGDAGLFRQSAIQPLLGAHDKATLDNKEICR